MPANYVIDMDGVIYLGNELIPGAKQFIDRLMTGSHRFLFLTNSSNLTPADLTQKLSKMGIDVSQHHFFTSAMATADFLNNQLPNGRAFIIGGEGLQEALHAVGYTIPDDKPDPQRVLGRLALRFFVDPQEQRIGITERLPQIVESLL